MAYVKGERDLHLKERKKVQVVHETDENQFHRTVANSNPTDFERCEERRLKPNIALEHKGGKDSITGWSDNSGNLTIIRAACNKSITVENSLKVSGEKRDCGNISNDARLSKNNAGSTTSKAGLIATSSSSSSSLSSQGFVGMKPNILKHKLASVGNLDNSAPNNNVSNRKTTKPFLFNDIPASNNVNSQEVQAQVEVQMLKKASAAVNAPLQLITSLSDDKNSSINDTSTVFCKQSQVLTGTAPTLTIATHGFRYKDAVCIQEKKPVLRAESSLQSSVCLILKDNSHNKPDDIIINPSLLSVGRGPLIAPMQHVPIDLSAPRPHSNSVPSYTDQNQISNASESKAPSEAVLNAQVAVGGTSSLSQPVSKPGPLRRGKWTVEEETYVARVIQDFNSGYLDAPAGTTLRTFLSDKLNCDPMRITKKFTGDACIGKRVFHPAIRCTNNTTSIDKAQNELNSLERRWRRRIEIQRRESAKKQAASAAAAAAAASGRLHLHGHIPHQSTTAENLQLHPFNSSSNDLAQAASWLDRANNFLSNTQGVKEQLKMTVHPGDSVEKEMEEVQRLIHEGPIIQKTSAGFAMLLESGSNDSPPERSGLTGSNDPTNKRKVSDHDSKSILNSKASLSRNVSGLHTHRVNAGFSSTMSRTNSASASTLYEAPAASKRLRKAYSTSNLESVTPSDNGPTDAAEDAEALMGFLSSVRQAAAANGTPFN